MIKDRTYIYITIALFYKTWLLRLNALRLSNVAIVAYSAIYTDPFEKLSFFFLFGVHNRLIYDTFVKLLYKQQ